MNRSNWRVQFEIKINLTQEIIAAADTVEFSSVAMVLARHGVGDGVGAAADRHESLSVDMPPALNHDWINNFMPVHCT